MLGLALTLPMILLSGPLAGYLMGQWVEKNWTVSFPLTPLLMVLGLAGSGWQVFQLIQKIRKHIN